MYNINIKRPVITDRYCSQNMLINQIINYYIDLRTFFLGYFEPDVFLYPIIIIIYY